MTDDKYPWRCVGCGEDPIRLRPIFESDAANRRHFVSDGGSGGKWCGPVVEREQVQSGSHDPVNSPTHYTDGPPCDHCGKTIECITITRRLSFNVGNAVKYLWREGKKGDAIEDLRKAAWYIADEIKRRTANPPAYQRMQIDCAANPPATPEES